jgi:hypothetical protein
VIDLKVAFDGLDDLARFFGARADGSTADRFKVRSQPLGKGTTPRTLPISGVVREATFRGMTAVVKFLVYRIRVNAPFRTGALRNSVTGFVGDNVVAGGDRFTQAAATTSFRQTKGGGVEEITDEDDVNRPERAASTDRGVLVGRSVGRSDFTKLAAKIVVTAPYAYFVHEFFIPSPSGTIEARVKDDTVEGGVGGKYVERVVQHHTNRVFQIMRQEFIDAFARLSLVSKGQRGASIGPLLKQLAEREAGKRLETGEATAVVDRVTSDGLEDIGFTLGGRTFSGGEEETVL